MTSCVTEDDLSLKVSEPASPSDVCFLNNLHEVVKWEIMKQLPFKDYRNLALTCKKWYQTAISAPRSVKPDVFHEKLIVENSSLSIPGLMPRSYMPGVFTIDHILTTFQLLKKVKCSKLSIHEELSGDLTKFILLNSSHFDFKMIRVYITDMDKEQYCSIVPLLDLAPEITWVYRSMVKNDFLLPFLEEYVSHRCIHVDLTENLECVNFVMKQWINGERPNLERLTVDSVSRSTTLRELTRGMEEFVQNVNGSETNYCAAIVVPGLPVFMLFCAYSRFCNVQCISFLRDDSYCRSSVN